MCDVLPIVRIWVDGNKDSKKNYHNTNEFSAM